MRRLGHTLTELLMVVTVLAVLAGLAIPQYNRTRERSLRRAVRDVMLAIYAGEQVFRSQATPASYRAIAAPGAPADWNAIFMDNPNGGVLPVTFSIAAGAATFTATAERNGGPCDTNVITIDQNRTIAGSWLACF